MRPAARAARGLDDQVDGPLLGLGRTALEEAGVGRAVRPGVVDQVGVLGVHQHQRPEPRGLCHRIGELAGGEVWELLDT